MVIPKSTKWMKCLSLYKLWPMACTRYYIRFLSTTHPHKARVEALEEENEGIRHVYQSMISNGELQKDKLQETVVDRLQEFTNELMDYKYRIPSKKGFFSSFFNLDTIKPPCGIYLYGSVGCGKTMLMDLLYDNIKVSKKKRLHFNAFMLDVHKRIHAFKLSAPPVNHSDKTAKALDPIPPVASDIRNETFLLCFDEFQITDVADAMILKRLFTCLFDNGLIVIATSNRHPKDLYKSGLQRSNFIPFIGILEKNCEVIQLNSDIDYRSINLSNLCGIYFDSNNSRTCEGMDNVFNVMCEPEKVLGHEYQSRTLRVLGRDLHIEKACGGVAMFTFEELCLRPVGAVDYIEIASNFHTVFIKNIPILSPKQKIELRRFIVLIDNLYDAQVKLICSASLPLEQLFDISSSVHDIEEHRILMDDLGIKLGDKDSQASLFTAEEEIFAIKRTVSRLTEMQSEQYWESANAKLSPSVS